MTNVKTIQSIPEYLQPYIAKQDPTLYTPMDHATWRYILKISQAFFAKYAHQKYLDGLRETGISTDRIPLIEEMDAALRKFGWQAVPVVGFIPPAVFMEFLSLGVLPIACDMRQIEHLAYTPAPDIVHEAAGHAPIIADPEYAAYLRSYGEISRKAIFSSQDMEVYHAIRHLSDTKEDPHSTPEQIAEAEERLDRANQAVTYASEATLLARMGWWTFEYGLVGDLAQPKIYGAGLLSSVGESYHCLGEGVKKIPFSIACIETSYDITRPQPQLFVAPDFQALKDALEELADQMAFRKGGKEGLAKAVQAETVTTTELDSGVQMSGILQKVYTDERNHPCYLKFSGPTQLSYKDQEIQGQGADYHREGFGTPITTLTEGDLQKANLSVGKRGTLNLTGAVSVEGKLVNVHKQSGKILLLTFEDCTVKKGDELLFLPEWGKFDMVCGARIASVFGGPADRKSYLKATGGFGQAPCRPKTNLTPENRDLNQLYAEVRELRGRKTWKEDDSRRLGTIFEELEEKYPKDWLLRYELLELNSMAGLNLPFASRIHDRLKEICKRYPEKTETIERGLQLL